MTVAPPGSLAIVVTAGAESDHGDQRDSNEVVSQRLGVALSPLCGLQVAGLAATLPLGVPG
ncbi:MAG: hypothetical protein ACRDST_07540 [Pseudonocardiaceae bacterium]